MRRLRASYSCLIIVTAILSPISAPAQPATPQQTLRQYVADLQNNPNDAALRRKIITLAQTMKTPPAIPPAAHQDYVMAVTFVESAKDNTGYEHAIDHFKSALLAAPWWMDAYKKLAIAQKAAGHYDDAIATLNLYLLAKSADASDAQDEIYKLMALKQAAADQQVKDAERQREEQQRAYEASPEGRFQALLKKIDGRRYSWDFHQPRVGGTDRRYIDVKGGVFLIGIKSWGRSDGWNDENCCTRLEIAGRETTQRLSDGYAVYTVSDDGERITKTSHYQSGQVLEEVFNWER